MIESTLSTRIAFVAELASRLHQYGAAAPRVENAINGVSKRLDVSCHVMCSPTSIILSCADRERAEDPLAQVTQVIRLSPGEIDLDRLCQADAIADKVTTEALTIAQGFSELRALANQPDRIAPLLRIASFGIASVAVAAILHTSWADMCVAGCTGAVIGILAQACKRHPALAPSFEALSALMGTFIATSVSFFVVPLALKSVVLASLIVLLPGLALTTAVRELSTGHLVSGVARIAGAMATLLKLGFGTVAAAQLCKVMHIVAAGQPLPPVPGWVEWAALAAGCYSFAVLFKSARRDYPLVIASVALGYLLTYSGSVEFSPEFGVFIAGVAIGALSNLYAWLANRPGALIRLPGIIMLVPGSLGFRSLALVFERDVFLSIDTAFSLIAVLVSLVAGLLFGDLLITPRRSL